MAWIPNGPVLECHLKTKQPYDLKSKKWPQFRLFRFKMVGTKPNHLKTEQFSPNRCHFDRFSNGWTKAIAPQFEKSVLFLNVSGIQIPTVSIFFKAREKKLKCLVIEKMC